MQSPVGRGLNAVELGVLTASSHEVVMRADLDDARPVEHDDDVRHADRAEAVRDQDRDAAVGSRGVVHPTAGCGSVSLEQRVLGFGVECGRRLVKHEQQRVIPHEPAGERELLPLPERHFDTAWPSGPELCLQARLQLHDHVICAGSRDGRDDGGLVFETGDVPDADRVTRPEFEAKEILECAGQPLAPFGGMHAAEIGSVDEDVSGRRLIEFRQEFHECALARTVFSHDRNNGARREVQVHIVEDQPFSARVRERHVIETDALLEPGWYGQVGASHK